MSNLNNFNICPRCNTPNPMVAKYCFQCGTQLKSPDTPIVCSKCNTVNTGRSSFCKTCGNKLVGTSATKICPRCSNVVNANSTICDKCGYAFAAVGVTYPDSAQGAKAAAKMSLAKQAAVQRQKGKASGGVASGKGRAGGFFAFILALAAAYFLIMPPFMAIPNFAYTFLTVEGAPMTGWGYIMNIIANFGTFFTAQTVYDWLILGVFVLTVLTVLVEIIGGLIQLIGGKQAKRGKVLLLIVTILTALAVCTAHLAQNGANIASGMTGFLADVFNWFGSIYQSRLTAVYVSWVFNLCPAYMFLAYIFSLFFKMSKKEKKVLLVERQ